MNKEQFTKLEVLLQERGYKRYNQQWQHEDYILCKSFHKDDNQWEENRAAYQIIISVYDWTNPDRPIFARLPDNMRKRVALEIHVDISRTIDERLDLSFLWHDDETIENVEHLAEEYFQAMCLILPKPREE